VHDDDRVWRVDAEAAGERPDRIARIIHEGGRHSEQKMQVAIVHLCRERAIAPRLERHGISRCQQLDYIEADIVPRARILATRIADANY